MSISGMRGAADRAVHAWRIDIGEGSCKCAAMLAGHGAAVGHVVFSLDRRTLASGATDGSAIIRWILLD